MNKFRLVITSFVLAVYLFGITGFASAFVLCYGSDGHRQIEQSHNGVDCAGVADAPDHSAYSITACCADEHCGSCMDVPLQINIAQLHEKRESAYQFSLKYVPYCIIDPRLLYTHQKPAVTRLQCAELQQSISENVLSVVLLI